MGGFHRHASDNFPAPLTTHNLQRLEKSLSFPINLSAAHVGATTVKRSKHQQNQNCKRNADHCQVQGHIDPLDSFQQVQSNIMEALPSRQNERWHLGYEPSAGLVDVRKGSSRVFYTTTAVHDVLCDTEVNTVCSARLSNTSHSLQHLSTWKELPALPKATYIAQATPISSTPARQDGQLETSQNDNADRRPDSQHYSKQIQISSRFSRSGSLTDDSKDLRLLSIAMMTVDNGFEDQWWQQGPKEQIDRWSRGWRGDANSTMPHDTSLAVELPVDIDTHPQDLPRIKSQQTFADDLVSPLSNTGTL